MSKESIIVFDDGSLESKVLQHELKDTYNIKIINVDNLEKLDKWVDKVIIGGLKNIVKIFLHFPYEDYVQKDIRTDIMEIERKNPNIRIIPWYEQAPRNGIKNRAANYGIQQTIAVGKSFKLPEPTQTFKAVKQTEVASDTLKAGPERKEGFTEEFTNKLEEFKNKRRRKDAKHE